MTLEETILRLTEQTESRLYGKYRGTVVDNSDPLDLGRVRAQVVGVLPGIDTGWCTPCVPYAGSDKGWFVIPEVGDGVWIEFEEGDPSRPIWTGCWWGSGEIPKDPTGSQGETRTKLFKSAGGLIVDLDDASGEISVSDSSGSNLMNIKVNDGQIVIQATTSVTLEAPEIDLGNGASHPAVLGDSLIQFLNQLVIALRTHVHGSAAGPTSPPVAPFTPADPSLLSTIVLVK